MKLLLLYTVVYFYFCFLENCAASGLSSTSRPTEANPHKYPFIVSIFDKRNGDTVCSGTLISKQFAVTAVHCFTWSSYDLVQGFLLPNISHNYEVGVGVHDLQAPYTSIGVESVKYHPNYIKKNYTNDIALVKLSNEVEFSAAIRPMCLRDMPARHAFRSGIIAGFGTTEKGKPIYVLLEGAVPIWSNWDCNRTYASSPTITPDKICVGGNGSATSCLLSGSPLFATFAENYYYLGFSLFGDANCGLRKPDVYLRVLPFIDWLKRNSDYSGENCAVPDSEIHAFSMRI